MATSGILANYADDIERNGQNLQDPVTQAGLLGAVEGITYADRGHMLTPASRATFHPKFNDLLTQFSEQDQQILQAEYVTQRALYNKTFFKLTIHPAFEGMF